LVNIENRELSILKDFRRKTT